MSGSGKGCLAGFAMLLAIVPLVLWAYRGDTNTVRSRLTLVVETPEGERSGSSVSQRTILSPGPRNRAIGFGSLSTTGEDGEAVVVDLGSYGLLFATLASETALRSGRTSMYNGNLLPFPQQKFLGEVGTGIWEKDQFSAYLDELNRRKPKGELPIKDLPMLVRFRDPNDPSSVERVNPLNLAANFGPGVTLRQAFLEITDEPLTRGIETRLPWVTRTFPRTLMPQPPGLRPLKDASLIELLTCEDFRRRFP
jgi:hypothetical protein